MNHPGWPAVLRHGSVTLRPYRRRDSQEWSAVRRANQEWLRKWEPTLLGDWDELNSVYAYHSLLRDMRQTARQGTAMPFAVWLDDGQGERMVGQLSIGSIVRRAFCSGYAGYWVAESAAGRGVTPTALALAVDHAFRHGGLHRIEVNIRPENAPSRRVVEKLGFREEAMHRRYLHIDGHWRDHIGYAVTAEEVAGDGGLMGRWRRAQDGARPRRPR